MIAKPAVRRVVRWLLLVLVVVSSASMTTATPAGARQAELDGPHSPLDRTAAETQVLEVDGASVASFDLGDLNLGPIEEPTQYRAPIRGVLVTPRARPNAPLVILNHLRYPACPDNELAYPCTRGAEMRFDFGMRYLAVALAGQGYSTLIPDLSPLYVPSGIHQPYQQAAGLNQTLDTMLTVIEQANRGEQTVLGTGLTGAVDTTRLGILAHSRSGTFAPDLIQSLTAAGKEVASVLVYGGAFETEYGGREGDYTPPMPDVPFLSLVGDQDADTGFLSSRYFSHTIAQERTTPALMALVPGLGHTYINKTLSAARIDDRICASKCPNAKAHRAFLTTTALHWFNSTMRHRPNRWFPLRSTDVLPGRLSGLPVRWTALSNGARTNVFLAGTTSKLQAIGEGASVRECWPAEPMSPFRRRDCPLAELGVTQNASRIAQVTLTDRGGVRLATESGGIGIRGARSLALHLSPTGDRADNRPYSPLVIELRTRGGRKATIDLPRAAALRDRATAESSGVYPITTLRVRLPGWIRSSRVRSLTLHSTRAGSAFDIRAIDLIRR